MHSGCVLYLFKTRRECMWLGTHGAAHHLHREVCKATVHVLHCDIVTCPTGIGLGERGCGVQENMIFLMNNSSMSLGSCFHPLRSASIPAMQTTGIFSSQECYYLEFPHFLQRASSGECGGSKLWVSLLYSC